MDDKNMSVETSESVSRRSFIKGVIAAGAVASSSAYLFRSAPLHGQPSEPGSVERKEFVMSATGVEVVLGEIA